VRVTKNEIRIDALSTGQQNAIPNSGPVGVSADQRWLAFVQPGKPRNYLVVQNLETDSKRKKIKLPNSLGSLQAVLPLTRGGAIVADESGCLMLANSQGDHRFRILQPATPESPDGTFLELAEVNPTMIVAQTSNSKLVRWNLETAEQKTLVSDDELITCVTASYPTEYVFYANDAIHRLSDSSLDLKPASNEPGIQALCTTPDGRVVVVAVGDGRILVFQRKPESAAYQATKKD
jgi:hypothetical protein